MFVPLTIFARQNGRLKTFVSELQQLNAPLETLPAELRREILGTLPYEELRALVHASPVFHQQYRLDRKSLLPKCLDTTLRSVAVDACAAYRSVAAGSCADGTENSQGKTRERVAAFLQSYERQRSRPSYSISAEGFTLDEVVAMAAFHVLVKPLVNQFTGWALSMLAIETEDAIPSCAPPLSMTEKMRIMRALYRFQICCNLFGRGDSHGVIRVGYDYRYIHEAYFCLFEPWEIEEVTCIQTFVKRTYDRIFIKIHWDVHEDNPKFDGQGRPPTPDGAFDFGSGWKRDKLLIGTTSRGLQLLHKVLHKMRDHAHLVSTMQKQIASKVGHFMERALDEDSQNCRRRESPSIRDLKEERRDPLPFKGDLEPDGKGPYPPLSWTLMWNGTYSNLYGDWLVPEHMRCWGYIMWDGPRLESTGAVDVLARNWGAYPDPRD